MNGEEEEDEEPMPAPPASTAAFFAFPFFSASSLLVPSFIIPHSVCVHVIPDLSIDQRSASRVCVCSINLILGPE